MRRSGRLSIDVDDTVVAAPLYTGSGCLSGVIESINKEIVTVKVVGQGWKFFRNPFELALANSEDVWERAFWCYDALHKKHYADVEPSLAGPMSERDAFKEAASRAHTELRFRIEP